MDNNRKLTIPTAAVLAWKRKVHIDENTAVLAWERKGMEITQLC